MFIFALILFILAVVLFILKFRRGRSRQCEATRLLRLGDARRKRDIMRNEAGSRAMVMYHVLMALCPHGSVRLSWPGGFLLIANCCCLFLKLETFKLEPTMGARPGEFP